MYLHEIRPFLPLQGKKRAAWFRLTIHYFNIDFNFINYYTLHIRQTNNLSHMRFVSART